jgi:hypothetical protein
VPRDVPSPSPGAFDRPTLMDRLLRLYAEVAGDVIR